MNYERKRLLGEIFTNLSELNNSLDKERQEDEKSLKIIVSKMKEYRNIAESLWKLLDDIDTSSDIWKPTKKEPNKCMGFYNNTMDRVKERFQYLKSDGYILYDKDEYQEYLNNQPKKQEEFLPKINK